MQGSDPDRVEERGSPPELLEAYRQMLTCLFVSTILLIALIATPLVIVAILNRSSSGAGDTDLPSSHPYPSPVLSEHSSVP